MGLTSICAVGLQPASDSQSRCACMCVFVCVVGSVSLRDLKALHPILAYALHQSPSIIEGIVCVGTEMVYFYHTQTNTCMHTYTRQSCFQEQRKKLKKKGTLRKRGK